MIYIYDFLLVRRLIEGGVSSRVEFVTQCSFLVEHLFEGGVYSRVAFVTQCSFLVQHLFEGGVYSRVAFNRRNMVFPYGGKAMLTLINSSSLELSFSLV